MNAKEKILIEASKLIHSKGFNNTSVQDILDAASVTKSNFYYHFSGKEQLGLDVLAERIRQFTTFIIEPSLHADRSAVQRLDAFFDKILWLAARPEGELGCPFGNLAQEMSTLHEALRQVLSEFFRMCANSLEQCFEEGKKAGEFRQDMPSRQLAEFAIAQVQGAFLLRKTHKDADIMRANLGMLRQYVMTWSTGPKEDIHG
ncbi:MAG: TetR/AcrR family transcriptional regulator [Candidatus Abyssubacteria bacterium]